MWGLLLAGGQKPSLQPYVSLFIYSGGDNGAAVED